MSVYHKIQTVFNRNPETKFKTVIEGQWSLPEFEYLRNDEWHWTEKVDGTNVRVIWDGSTVKFGGKTDDAQMPPFLLAKLAEMFPMDKIADVFPATYPDNVVVLYGEGYGARIQKGGGNYIPDGVDFILFDVAVGELFLSRESVTDIANKLQIGECPLVGYGTLPGMVEFVRSKPKSVIAVNQGTIMEGVVARPRVELRNRMGHRIITKLKVRDFA